MPFPQLRRFSRVLLALAAITGFAGSLAASPSASADTACAAGSALNIVAHEDDDLLFQSPRLISAIRGGLCVRTVYVTAGDANDSAAYWASRENGVKAAYAQLANVANSWTTADAGIPGHPIPVTTLSGAANISLAFMRLPDGFRDGSGGSNNGNESLQKLYSGVINTITAVDNSSSYTHSTLQATILAFMNNYRATQIVTLDYAGSYGDGDHSDHHTVAYLVMAAHQQYSLPHTITGYQGYGITQRPSNVLDPDLTAKTNAFLAYAQYDYRTCNTAEWCSSRSEGAWFSRSYTVGTPGLTQGTGTFSGTGVSAGSNVAPSATVTASSQNEATGQSALKAVDGVIAGYPVDGTREWATVGGKAGSYLNLAFPTAVTLNRVVLYDRPNTNDQITGGSLTFSDGTTVAVPSLENSGQPTTINFTGRSTTSLRLTVTAVSGTTKNVGLSELQAYTGTPTNIAPSATVTASSQNEATGQSALKAVDGVIAGYPVDGTREWATVGGKAGSYLNLAFPTAVTLNRVVLYDRPNTNDQITGGSLTFSDGTTVAVPSLENSGQATTINFTGRSTTSLRLTVTAVSGTTKNVGLSELQAYMN
ncbi:LmbE family N-acetylglucosaminyl deacetylase [Arthrobacter pascens]|nr:LmbE family N-acetylglucosaminyl deacetylase [Arthrobacter pascens]